MKVPKETELRIPILRALRELGGSAKIPALEDTVVLQMNLPKEVVSYKPPRSTKTAFAYRTSWARQKLKEAGLITNSERGVWKLTELGYRTLEQRVHRDEMKPAQVKGRARVPANASPKTQAVADPADWRSVLINTIQSVSGDAFQRLCENLLQKQQFTEIVLKRTATNDGLYGHAVLRPNTLITIPIAFYFTRKQLQIKGDEIRDFRQMMNGNSERGIFITTSEFTSEATQEATRSGAPHIDLMDGMTLVETLKASRLGVHTKQVEAVEVDVQWFKDL